MVGSVLIDEKNYIERFDFIFVQPSPSCLEVVTNFPDDKNWSGSSPSLFEALLTLTLL